jgi:hypothetical protein
VGSDAGDPTFSRRVEVSRGGGAAGGLGLLQAGFALADCAAGGLGLLQASFALAGVSASGICWRCQIPQGVRVVS